MSTILPTQGLDKAVLNAAVDAVLPEPLALESSASTAAMLPVVDTLAPVGIIPSAATTHGVSPPATSLQVRSPNASKPVGTALRTRSEEFDAAFTHGTGAIAAALGGLYLMSETLEHRDLLSSLGCLLYAVALLGVLGCSTLSHLYLPDRLNRRFRAYDQGFIYLLAAGSLSPFALTYLRTPFWLTFYGLSVMLAFAGFLSKIWFTHRVDKISLWFYLLLGWGQAIALVPLLRILPSAAVGWIIAGAAFYSLGVVFLVMDRRRFHFHTIWHLFVLAACACHYYAILRYVVHGGIA